LKRRRREEEGEVGEGRGWSRSRCCCVEDGKTWGPRIDAFREQDWLGFFGIEEKAVMRCRGRVFGKGVERVP